jgi:ubiquinone/menaquinone biosynthesis C-methylase UbiE
MLKVDLPRRNEAYFDFVVDLKGTIAKHIYGEMERKVYPVLEAEFAAAHNGAKPAKPEEVGALVANDLTYQFSTGVKRKAQEMMWQGVIEAYTPFKDVLEEQLNQAHPTSGSTLTLDPVLELPDYVANTEFHIQPGGYYSKGDMSAIIFERGVNIYFRKSHDNFRIQKSMAQKTPAGNYQRILDIGCTDGGNTIAYKTQFPEAEVHGIDAAPGVLKMAYQNAVTNQVACHFSQQDIRFTNFPDNHFDLVTCFILFHEVPREAARQTLKEAYRILKPGGLMFSGDVTPFRENSTWRSFVSSWERDNNGEPFWREILEDTHMPTEFNNAGFVNVQEFGVGASVLSPKFPFVTMGYKPE